MNSIHRSGEWYPFPYVIVQIVWLPRRLKIYPVQTCVTVLGALLSALTVEVYAFEKPSVMPLAEHAAITIAIENNPSLAEMRARFESLKEVPSQVGALPDPMVSFNAMNIPTDTYELDQEAMTQLQVGISQVFPFPGKLGLKEKAAEYDAQAAGHSVDEMRLHLIKNVKSKWWQLYYVDRALETVANNRLLLSQLISVAKTKYETGKGLQQDVLLSQLELSRLMDQEIQLRAIRTNQAIQLNILMDRHANESISLPHSVSKKMPVITNEMQLFQRAESVRPRLKQMETKVNAARSRFDLAERGRYPDFKLGVTYGDRDGGNPLPRGGARTDFVSVMVGVKIPLYAGRKQSKAISQKNLDLQKSRYAMLDEKGVVAAEIATAVTDYKRAKQQFSLYGGGIIPQAQQTVQSMLAGYQVSEVDFLNLVRSQMTLFNYELQYWKALSEAKQALARLEAAVGEEPSYE